MPRSFNRLGATKRRSESHLINFALSGNQRATIGPDAVAAFSSAATDKKCHEWVKSRVQW